MCKHSPGDAGFLRVVHHDNGDLLLLESAGEIELEILHGGKPAGLILQEVADLRLELLGADPLLEEDLRALLLAGPNREQLQNRGPPHKQLLACELLLRLAIQLKPIIQQHLAKPFLNLAKRTPVPLPRVINMHQHHLFLTQHAFLVLADQQLRRLLLLLLLLPLSLLLRLLFARAFLLTRNLLLQSVLLQKLLHFLKFY